MYLLLNTATKTCYLSVLQNDELAKYQWEADRDLAKHLLKFLKEKLSEHNADFYDIKGLAVYQGPGSFTGLRIGITVFNTLADSLKVPIIGVEGNIDDWESKAIDLLKSGADQKIVLPFYGAEANITKQKK